MEWNKGCCQVDQGTYLIHPWHDDFRNLFWSTSFYARPGGERTIVAPKCGSYEEAKQESEKHYASVGNADRD